MFNTIYYNLLNGDRNLLLDKIVHRTENNYKTLFMYFTDGKGDFDTFVEKYKRMFDDEYWQKVRREELEKGG